MEESYFKTVLRNAEVGKEQWDEFNSECISNNANFDIVSFGNKFHLRPTKEGITIVSTIAEKPMRGKKVGRTTVKKHLLEIEDIINSEENDSKKLELLTGLGFKDRKKTPTGKREEDFQADMISTISNNEALKKVLDVTELIFMASEFILYESKDNNDRNRMDIIAWDGQNRLFFFELKEPKNTRDDAEEQVKKYIDLYSGTKMKEQMLEILKNYPGCINLDERITVDNLKIEGYAIKGYSNNVLTPKVLSPGIVSTIEFENIE